LSTEIIVDTLPAYRYDAVISTKNRHDPDKEVSVYWCMKCEIIIRIQRRIVHDKVTSVSVVTFKNKK